ncbi:MAG: xanthine dehydrogenase family protein molybdopterin-binding subunit [Alphaproteobacteria bacterium]|nr:xanthine dehydrogenase family protein molybdopterin-binding subunit [Alphaproteobacteria bacterium]
MPQGGVGARIPRLEDGRFMHGRGQFVADIALPGMLHAAFVRSPHAHARIRSVKKPDHAAGRVFVAADLVGVKPIRSSPSFANFRHSDFPVLAVDKARYVGEPVVMAIGDTPHEAEDLVAATVVDWDVLPPVMDMKRALAPGAPRLHEHWPDNMFCETRFDHGDIAAAIKAAKHVVTREYRTNRQTPMPLEGRACLAHVDHRNDEVVVYYSHQLPVPMQIGLATFLGVPQRRLRVICPDVGGAFGLKTFLDGETVAVTWAAITLDRPVRHIQDRREHLICDANTRDHWYRITAYADAVGKVLGIDLEAWCDTGAYSPWPWPAGIEASTAPGNIAGCYDIRAVRGRAVTVATSKPPGQPYRGVARPGACYGHEIVMDALAGIVGCEPHEIRARNLVRPEQMPYRTATNKVLDSGDYPEALRKAVAAIDVAGVRARQRRSEADGRRVGLGFAVFYEQTAYGTGPFGYSGWGIELVPGLEPATARLTGDGDLVLDVGVHSHGQGYETVFAQIAAEVLGIAPARVKVRYGDTTLAPAGTGTYTSRGAVSGGGAVATACKQLRKPIARIGAHLLQVAEDSVVLRDGKVYSATGSVSFAEIGRAWYHHPEELPPDVDPQGLTAVAGYKAIDGGVYSYSVHAAVVAVDPATGVTEILDYAIVEDCGTMLNPMLVDGQVLGGLAGGIGNALYEESTYDALGQPTATTLADYCVPSAVEVPEPTMIHMETPSPLSEFGVKGVGESGAIGPPTAIANAINDALRPLGAHLLETPMTPRRVLAAIAAAART